MDRSPFPVSRKSRFARSVFRVLLFIAAIVVSMLGTLMFFEESLIYFPSKYPQGEWNPTGFPFEDVNFAASDGVKLHGWYVPCPNARGAVLFLHGNGGNITHRADFLRALHKSMRASVFIFDYRGYGRSEGQPTEAGVYADARAARDWLAKRENIDPADIVFMGESFGGAVAVDLAANDGARGLVLISVFGDIRSVAQHHYGLLPIQYLMRSRFDSAAKIANYHGPLLQMHGDVDSIIPIAEGERLFAAANRPKEFLRIPGHDHNDFPPQEFFKALDVFFDKLPLPTAKDDIDEK